MFSFSLFPRKVAFFDMFSEAAQNMVLGSRLLKEMMEGYDDIKRIESIGDAITHKIFRDLNQTFITPIDREDIYALASCIDDVLDFIEAAADALVVFKIDKPTQEAITLVNII